MFREYVGDCKVNAYLNREDYRKLLKNLNSDKPSELEMEYLDLLEKTSKLREPEDV